MSSSRQCKPPPLSHPRNLLTRGQQAEEMARPEVDYKMSAIPLRFSRTSTMFLQLYPEFLLVFQDSLQNCGQVRNIRGVQDNGRFRKVQRIQQSENTACKFNGSSMPRDFVVSLANSRITTTNPVHEDMTEVTVIAEARRQKRQSTTRHTGK